MRNQKHCLTWNKPMTSKQAAKWWRTGGFIALELYNAEIKRRDEEIEKLKKEVNALVDSINSHQCSSVVISPSKAL